MDALRLSTAVMIPDRGAQVKQRALVGPLMDDEVLWDGKQHLGAADPRGAGAALAA